MQYTMRPLGAWTDPVTDPRQSTGIFKATWPRTLQDLDFELKQLEATHVVFQVDAAEDDIRLDGMLRAQAKVTFPGVRLAFESKLGPLIYATDAYEQRGNSDLTSWQGNFRAIALGLQALRAVDRYGISSRGQQYTGWKAITAGTTAIGGTSMTRDTALKVISDESGMAVEHLEAGNDNLLEDAILRAKRRTHPDRNNGDDGAWNAVDVASQVLMHRTG